MSTAIQIARNLTIVGGGGEIPAVDLSYDEDIGWDDAVAKAKEVKAAKVAIVEGMEVGFGRYIAELSTVHAVTHGGISKFATAIGMNYATMKSHRSRYLEAGQKRRWARKVEPATIELPDTGDDVVVDEVRLTGEDALLWRKLKPRMAQLELENRRLKRRARECPHCSGTG